METNNKVSEPHFMGGSGYFDIIPVGANVVFFAKNKQGSEKNKHPYYEDEDIEAAKQKAEFICKAVNEYDKLKDDNEKLQTALNWLLDAIPSQDNDHDWWPDELTESVRNANLILNKIEESK